MQFRVQVACLLLAALPLGAASVFPQSRPPAGEKKAQTAKQPERQLTPRQQRALALLDQLAEQAKEVKDDRVRIQLQSRIADLLWKYDEPRARQLLGESFAAAESIKTDKQPAMLGGLGDPTRGEVIRLAAERDLDLAEKLVKSMPDAPAGPDPTQGLLGNFQNERARHQLDLAARAAETDPARAARMARETLPGGVNMMFVPTLNRIRERDPKLADDVFRQALATVQNGKALPAFSLSLLGQYVFPNAPLFGSFAGVRSNLGGAAQPPVNPDLARQFLNLAYQTATDQAGGGTRRSLAQFPGMNPQEVMRGMGVFDYVALKPLLPYFDEYLPDKANLIRNRLNQINQDIPAQQREFFDQFAGQQEGKQTTAGLIDKAEAAGRPEQKDMYYTQAAQLALAEGDTERALALSEKISNQQIRALAVSGMRSQAAMKAVEKGEVEAALRYARELTDPVQRASMLGQLAAAMHKESDRPRAIELVAEAAQSLGQAENTPEKARLLLSLSATMARLDPPRGFELLAVAVEAVNKADFALPPTGQQGARAAVDLAIKAMEPNHGQLNFDEALTPLAREDFDRALGLAQAIEKKDFALQAQLAVCRAVLTQEGSRGADEKR
jgi:hypothetical protein